MAGQCQDAETYWYPGTSRFWFGKTMKEMNTNSEWTLTAQLYCSACSETCLRLMDEHRSNQLDTGAHRKKERERRGRIINRYSGTPRQPSIAAGLPQHGFDPMNSNGYFRQPQWSPQVSHQVVISDALGVARCVIDCISPKKPSSAFSHFHLLHLQFNPVSCVVWRSTSRSTYVIFANAR